MYISIDPSDLNVRDLCTFQISQEQIEYNNLFIKNMNYAVNKIYNIVPRQIWATDYKLSS